MVATDVIQTGGSYAQGLFTPWATCPGSVSQNTLASVCEPKILIQNHNALTLELPDRLQLNTIEIN